MHLKDVSLKTYLKFLSSKKVFFFFIFLLMNGGIVLIYSIKGETPYYKISSPGVSVNSLISYHEKKFEDILKDEGIFGYYDSFEDRFYIEEGGRDKEEAYLIIKKGMDTILKQEKKSREKELRKLKDSLSPPKESAGQELMKYSLFLQGKIETVFWFLSTSSLSGNGEWNIFTAFEDGRLSLNIPYDDLSIARSLTQKFNESVNDLFTSKRQNDYFLLPERPYKVTVRKIYYGYKGILVFSLIFSLGIGFLLSLWMHVNEA